MLCIILGIWFIGLRFLGDFLKCLGISFGNFYLVVVKYVEVEDFKSSEKGRVWCLCYFFDVLEFRLELI